MKEPQNVVRQLLAETLNVSLEEINELDPDESLADIGVDSLHLMSLHQKMRKAGLNSDYIAMVTNPTLRAWDAIVLGEDSAQASDDSMNILDNNADGIAHDFVKKEFGPLTNPREGFTPMPEERAVHYRAAGIWQGRTFDEMIAAAVENYPDNVALTDGTETVNYRQLWEQIDAVARNCALRGIKPGDHVICYLPNVMQFYPIYLGLVRLGAIPVLALPGHREIELEAFARSTKAKCIVTVTGWLGVKHADIAQNVVTKLREDGLALDIWTDLEDLVDHPEIEIDRSDWGTHPEDAAFLLVSGGSTAIPKLIPRAMDPYIYTLIRSNEICRVDDSTVFLATLPIAHNYANSSPGALGVLIAGGTVVLAPAPALDVCMPMIESHQVTITALVPPLALLWAEQMADYAVPESLVTVLIGGAKLTESAAERVEKAFPGCLQQVFGMAEGLVCYTALDASDEVRLYSQGSPMSEYDELLIVDATGRPVPDGETGELLVRGPYTISGYYRNDTANAKSFDQEGYYHTGDLVRIRPDGNLVVEGRAVQVINRAGEKILGEEVEEVLLRMDGITDASVAGLPDELLGQRIVAYIIVKEGSPLTVDDIRTHVRESGLAAFKQPDQYELVPTIPQTVVGKNDRSRLSGAKA